MAGMLPQFSASGDIYPCRFVKVSGAFTVAQCSAGTDKPIGISGEGTADKDVTVHASTTYRPVQIAEAGRVAKLQANTTWSAGALLKSDADGKGLTATTGTYAGAIGLRAAAAADQFVDVLVTAPIYVP